MYRLGRHTNRKIKRKVWIGILVFLLLLIAGGVFAGTKLMKQEDTTITTPKAITREYAPTDNVDQKSFDEDLFTITLPSDWVLKGHDTTPYNFYKWQASKKNEDNRWLEIFVDSVPPNKAFNRLLPVSVDNNKIIPIGSVSDNCATFTGPQGAGQNPPAGLNTLPAKWQGVDFTCDMANYSRNVVGVGTVANQTKLTLTGPNKGQHTFYVDYIDYNANPDYQILEDALSSIVVK